MGVAQEYPFEMPVTLAALGYSTTSIGKDHFGWVSGGPDGSVAFDGPDAGSCVEDEDQGADSDGQQEKQKEEAFPPPYGPNVGHGVPHG